FPGPHIVDTRIFDAARNRPEALAPEREPDAPPPTLDDLRRMAEAAGFAFRVTAPEDVADQAVEGIREGRFWLLAPSEETDARVRARTDSILERRDPPSPLG
ncbi:MAG: alcohol dehydrogenase, partial [Myxococcota bacterium]|nr:alcohol dehydrogenase [Myxococcota bacterium]